MKYLFSKWKLHKKVYRSLAFIPVSLSFFLSHSLNCTFLHHFHPIKWIVPSTISSWWFKINFCLSLQCLFLQLSLCRCCFFLMALFGLLTFCLYSWPLNNSRVKGTDPLCSQKPNIIYSQSCMFIVADHPTVDGLVL